MKERLLDFLRCLDCQNPFRLENAVRDSANEIIEGRLVCQKCRANYLIQNGIPRITRSVIEPIKKHTAHRFGDEWHIFDNLGKDYESDLLKEFIYPVAPDVFKDAVVLEAGCGAGRNIRRIAEYGAKEVIGVDLSHSVDVAYRKTRDLPNVHVVQCDIYAIPLTRNFDVVFSAGVLHHLPDPHKGFETVYQYARPGGWVLNTVYGKENNEWLEKYVTPLRKKVTIYIPPRILYVLSFLISCPIYLVLRLVYKPLNEITWTKPLAAKLFYNDFSYRMVCMGFTVVFAQIYDQLTAPVAHFISQEEIKGWVAQIGLKDVQYYWRNKNSWNFPGRK